MEKLSLPRKELLVTIQQALRYVSNRPQLPILSCIHIETLPGTVICTATDLRAGIRIKNAVSTVKESTQLVCPARLLMDFLQSCSDEIFSLEASSPSQIELACGKNKATINSFSVDEYPLFPSINGKKISLKLSDISQASELVAFAASIDETRPILTAMLIQNVKSQIKMVATDGFRLALATSSTNSTEPFELLIPAKIFQEIMKLYISEGATDLNLLLSEDGKQALFSTSRIEIVTRLIEGPFPEYEKIIPTQFEYELRVPAEEFEKVVKTAVLFGKDSSNIVKLEAEGKILKITAQSSVAGLFSGDISLSEAVSQPINIAFNGKYLLEILSRVSTEEIMLKLNSPLKPAALSLPGSDDFLYVVMPFKMNES